jgi:hypothetical protein
MNNARTWKCPECGHTEAISYDWLAEHGGPVCSKDDCDMELQLEVSMNDKTYHLHLDGKLFRRQRELLMRLVALVHGKQAYNPKSGDEELLEGLLALTDSLADQAHDWYGMDCLLDQGGESDTRCDCEEPGFFCSGVPGILAHMQNGRLAEGAQVNRCDLCQRYPSDEAAFERLRELGHGPS